MGPPGGALRNARELASAAARGRAGAPLEVTLRDGSRVLLRPVRPEDEERIQRGYTALSARSRYLRFHSDAPGRLTGEQLRSMTQVDHRDQVVWVALDERDPEGPIVAMASYVRLTDPPTTAEIALAVVDRFQGRGLGTVLLRVLVEVARENGVGVVRSYVLAQNAAMLHILDELGAERSTMPGGVEVADLALPPQGEDVEGSAVHDLLRAASRLGETPFLSGLHPALWSRTRTTPLVDDGPGRERPPLDAWVDRRLQQPTAPAPAEDGDAEGGEGP